MEQSVKQVIIDIIKGKVTHNEMQNLIQLIAQELDIRTTSNYAKKINKSYNGVKNFRAYILIDGVKFHSDNIKVNGLEF